MIEVPISDDFQPTVNIHGDIEPFVSPVDGTVIRSRAHMQDYMARRDLIHYDPSIKREEDRYASGRKDVQMRELLWEKVDKMYQQSDVKRYLRTRR